MKKGKIWTLGFVFFIAILPAAFAQDKAPVLRSQRALGGDRRDAIFPAAGVNVSTPYKVLRPDSDGGYIMGGSTFTSNNGDVTGTNSNTFTNHVWILKLDSALNIKWRRLYGGSAHDILHAIEPTKDGGYIFIANSESIGGQVIGNHGFNDIWTVKLDKNGNIQWSKCYGGTGQDVSQDIIELNDGYIISGSAGSKNGNVTGHHNTDPDGFDAWVIRTDLSGNILWNKCYGTSVANEFGGNIRQTAEGGFILTAIAGRNGEDVTGHHGDNGQGDIWLMKLSATGSIQWQKCIGGNGNEGTSDIELTADGGYILATSTNSWDGDVSGNHLGPTDGWLVKVSATGNIQWQRCFGGGQGDGFNDVIVTPDGGYLTAGWTSSRDGDITEWFGNVDYSIAKFNTAGNLVWQKSFGGQGGVGGYSFAYGVVPTIDNEFIVLGNTDATTGMITGNHGDNDLWLIRAGTSNVIKGNAFLDKNSNGVRDAGEINYSKVMISSQKNGVVSSNISDDGAFYVPVDTGTYVTTAVPFSPYFNVVPSSKTSVFSSYFNTDSFDFALQPIQVSRDVAISLFALTPARPGFPAVYQIFYENTGTESLAAGSIKLVKPAGLTYLTSIPAHSSVNADTITWNYSTLDPGQSSFINVGFNVQASFGSLLQTMAVITPQEAVLNPYDDTAVLKQVVTGSYDPNDKQESNGGTVSRQYITDGKSLHYLIRFQNTGTDTAFNVVVRDTLDSKLDWNTLEMISASHAYSLQITGGNKLAWEFRNILLPDSNVNEPASHGYIAYRIRPKNTVTIGDTIRNSAGIYFDFNLPVLTNTEPTVVMSGVLPVRLSQFEGVLSNNIVNLNWKTATEENTKLFEIERSVNGVNFIKIGNVKASGISSGASYAFIDRTPAPGFNYYRLKIVDEDGKYYYSTIVIINMKKADGVTLNIYPNPSPNGVVSVNVYGKLDGVYQLNVLDMNGRLILSKNIESIVADGYSTTLNLGALQKGVYLIRFAGAQNVISRKIVIR